MSSGPAPATGLRPLCSLLAAHSQREAAGTPPRPPPLALTDGPGSAARPSPGGLGAMLSPAAGGTPAEGALAALHLRARQEMAAGGRGGGIANTSWTSGPLASLADGRSLEHSSNTSPRMPRRKDCRLRTERGRRAAGGARGGAGRRLGLGPARPAASVPPSHRQLGLGWGSGPRPAGGSLARGAQGRGWQPAPRGSSTGPLPGGAGVREAVSVSLGTLLSRRQRCGQDGDKAALGQSGCRPGPRPLSCPAGRAGWA